jgi:glycolate oxidase FAD binding subunit
MAKLYTGSFGALGVVAGAWLRLRPQPACRAAFTSRLARDSASFERARAHARTESLRAYVWNESPADAEAELLIELGSSEAGVRHDEALLARTLSLEPGGPETVDRLRDARAQAASRHPIGLRARVLATRLDEMRQALLAAGFEVSIDLGLGLLTARGGETSIDAHGLLRLRERAIACGGHASFEWLPAAGFDDLDVFGEAPGTRALAANLKARFDPRGILNPGRFVMGS